MPLAHEGFARVAGSILLLRAGGRIFSVFTQVRRETGKE